MNGDGFDDDATLRKQPGFTLLEVLIAMSLISLVVTGAMQLSQQRIRTVIHIEEKLAASQIIGNVMQEFRLQGSPLEPTENFGDVTMAERAFRWQRTIQFQSEERRYRIHLQVFLEDSLIQDATWYQVE